MAFESVQIQSQLNGSGTPVVGYREDLSAGDVVILSLTTNVGVASVQWNLKGRPEGSVAGGSSGPEPISLGAGFTASFTVDADDVDGFHLDGTYVVEAVLDPGSPGETRRTAIVARLSGLTLLGPNGTVLPLRKPGGFESMEDTEVPTIRQGWKTQLNRWLEYFRRNGGGGTVNSVSAGPGISVTGTSTNPVVNNTGVLSVGAGTGISITGTGANPIVNNTGVLSITAGLNISLGGTAANPIINAAGSGSGGANPTLFRRSNLAGMAGIDASGFLTSDAHACEVLTVGDFYRYVPGSTMTADGITVVNNTGGGGGQWARMGVANEAFMQARFWAVDPVGGSDEAVGWGANQTAAEAAPLKTFAELNRRLVMSSGPLMTNLRISVLNDVPLTDNTVLSNLRMTGTFFTFVNVVGKRTQVGPDYVVTAYSTENPAANTGFLVTATGLDASKVDLIVQNAAGTKTAIVQSCPSTNTLRLTMPTDFNVETGNADFAPADFTIGETIRFFQVPRLPKVPIGAGVVSGQVAQVRLGYGSAAQGDVSEIGDVAMYFGAVVFEGGIISGGTSGGFVSCGFRPGSDSLPVSLTNNISFNIGNGVRGDGLLLLKRSDFESNHMDIEAGQILVEESCLDSAGNSPISVFNCTNALGAIYCYLDGVLSMESSPDLGLYGSGNTCAIVSTDRGGKTLLPAKANIYVTTSAPAPFLADGQGVQVADLPYFDLSTNTSVVPWT